MTYQNKAAIFFFLEIHVTMLKLQQILISKQYFNWSKIYVIFFSNIIEVVDGRMLVFDPKEDREDFFYQGQKQQRRDLNKKENRDQKFAFDVVFGPNANNEDVYAGTVIQNW